MRVYYSYTSPCWDIRLDKKKNLMHIERYSRAQVQKYQVDVPKTQEGDISDTSDLRAQGNGKNQRGRNLI
jgi:hypothetical protein